MKTKFSVLLANPIVILVLFAPLLSSSFTFKNLTRNKPVTRDILLKLEPGKVYMFELKTGPILKIHIESIDGDTIGGYVSQDGASGELEKSSYSESFDDVIKNVTKISVLKHNPYLTSSLIVVASFATAFLIWVAAWSGWL